MATSTSHSSDLPQSSLYVGDLHPKVTEATLFTKFSEIGNVLSARVCRDVASRDSLGYAYVNYQDPKDAERALENMNYDVLEGRPIRIMWSHRDPSLRKSGKGNVFIKNLEKSIEQKELYDTFRYFGKILSCKIACDEAGNSKGYGFVHFASEDSANAVIHKLNNMVIRDRVVYVGKFIPSSERKSKAGKAKFNNCYVKNFGTEYDDEWLRSLFAEFGEIKSAVVAKDENGKSKGFGFVCFHDPDNAEKAALALHNKKLDDHTLYVTKALRKEERQEELRQRAEKQRQERQLKYEKGVNLYVKNLDDSVNDEKLRESFIKYGAITSAKVMTDTNGSRLFGFVCFANPEDATRAVSEMNGTVIGTKPLYVAIAQRKEDRRAKLLAEHQQRMQTMRPAFGGLAASVAHPTTQNYYQTAYQNRFYNLMNQTRWARGPVSMVPHAMGGTGAVTGTPRGVPSAMPGHYTLTNPAGTAQPSQLQTGANQIALNTTMNQYRTQPQQAQQNTAHQVAVAHQAHAIAAGRSMLPQSGAAPSSMVPGMHTTQPMLTSVQQQASAHLAHQRQLQQVQHQRVNTGLQHTATAVQQQQQQQSAVAQQAAQALAHQQAQHQQQQQQKPILNVAGGAAPMPRLSMAEVASGQFRGNPMGIIPNQQSGVRFNQTARNVAPNAGVQHQQAAQQAANQPQQATVQQQQQGVLGETGESGAITMAMLAQMPDNEQKQMLGNRLFPLIKKRYSDMAGKLTGMLLQMESSDVIHMLESKEALQTKLDEAITVIQNHRSNTVEGGDKADTSATAGTEKGKKGGK